MEDNYLISRRSKEISGDILVPGDKSISHRALILASQAGGESKIFGLLESEDVLNTKTALKKLGVSIIKEGDDYIVLGQGLGSFRKSEMPLDLGNSGTGCRLLMGLLAPYEFETEFTGDHSLSSRPMMRVIKPLSEMGADIISKEGGLLPIRIKATDLIKPIEYELPVASAQVKSAILLAALNIKGKTTVIENKKTRDHTERMMEYLGINIKVKESKGKSIISVEGGKQYSAKDIQVPADPSSAAFPIVAATIVPGSEVTVRNILANESRFGLFQSLQEMGADIEINNKRTLCGEEVADITARYSKLKAITVPAERAPSMIDEYPILSIAAAMAEGETVMEGLEELKVKESDRLSAIYQGLKAVGVSCEMGDDFLKIIGGRIKGGCEIKTHGDHRIAMSFLVAGMVAEEPIRVDKPDMIATSFPRFKDLMNTIGAEIAFLS